MHSGNITHIVRQFLPHITRVYATNINSGLINKTYLITTGDIKPEKYILQALNTAVFTNYKAVMHNIERVNEHLASEIKKHPGCAYQNMVFYKTTTGNMLYKNPADNNFWRLSDYIDSGEISGDATASEAGRILGVFHRLLANFDVSKLQMSLPGFHDIEMYYHNYKSTVKQKHKRRAESPDIRAKIEAFSFLIEQYQSLKREAALPLRVVHNDPKIDNILFDKNHKALGLIDWDTLMPGTITTDFGDAIRSLCNTVSENCKNPEKVSFDLKRYQDFAKAYHAETKAFITKEELHNLAFFALLITLEQAIRFYTDYLQNDKYYKITYPRQNLLRAKVQLKLLDAMYKDFDQMQINPD